MTETNFIETVIKLAKKGTVLLFVKGVLDFTRRMVFVNAGFSLRDYATRYFEEPGSAYKKLIESSEELKSLALILTDEFHLKDKHIKTFNPDYVVDEREYLPFTAENTPVPAGKQ